MKLVFAYNADAGIAAGIIDSIHKAISPGTYSCSLCAITYGAVRMDPKWKAWLKAQPFESVFYHRPDFARAWPGVADALPAIWADRAGSLTLLAGADDIAAAANVDALIALIERRIGDT